MAIIQISKIQQRAGNIVDLPQLDEAEFGWATDVKKLYIGKTSPNENIEVLTSYSNISFSQIEGSYGNLDINSSSVANGQVLAFTGTDWTNRGGNAGGLINLGDVSNVKIEGGALTYVLETDGAGNLSWAPKTTIIAFIANATQADPGVITTVEENYFVNGSYITITDVPGMTELNGNSYYVKTTSSTTFELYSDSALTTTVDTTGYTEFPYTTVTNTYTGTNKIRIGDTSLLNVNDPVVFLGTLFGGLENNTTYYVTDIPDAGAPGNISVSLTEGGANVDLATGSGSADLYVPGGRIVSLISGAGGTGTGVAGGSNTQVQFNNTNILDGSSDFTFNFGVSPKLLTLNGNANVGNLNSTSLVTASRFISNVAIGSEPITVTSTTRVANLNVASANMADFAGNVTIATQSNITSVGTLTTLNVSARVNATGFTSNVSTGTAPFTVSSTTRVANLNVNYANVSDFEVVTNQTTGTFYPTFVSSSATGNRALGANANLSFDVATGNLATNIFYANGNITGGNLATNGNVSVTGNVSAGNIITTSSITTGTSIFVNGFVQSPYAIVAPQPLSYVGTGSLSTITTALSGGGLSSPYSLVADPTGRFAYVTNSGANTVGQYLINQSTGALSAITSAIASGTGPFGIAVDPLGRFVYVANETAGTISQYSINQTTGALTTITTAIAAGTQPRGIVVDAFGRFVYVTNYIGNTVSQYSINQTTGALTSITTAILAGSRPWGVTSDPTGRYVYVCNSSGDTISCYSINQSTGALTSLGSAVASTTTPSYIAMHPAGAFVYVSGVGSGTVKSYSISFSTGLLTQIGSTTLPSSHAPTGLKVDATGKYLYVNSSNGNLTYTFPIRTDGTVSSSSSTVATGNGPYDMAVDPTGRFIYSVNYTASTVSQFVATNLSVGSANIAGNLNVSGLFNGNITSLTTGANTTAGSITGNWTLTAGSRFNATYADLAEYYSADQMYEPGTVVEFGGVNEITLGSNNTTKVAGVVSTDPAYAMNAKCLGEHPTLLALQGRVPTKVTGNIAKGDMMISAGNGYATACNSPILGTVIGKSLENFSGTGVIEIAVGRI